MTREPLTAFVLGGGGVLGSTQVGMLRALAEHGIRPDVVLGTSIGALNGVFVAADPTVHGAARLAEVWEAVVREGVFLENPVRQAARVAKYRTHVLSNAPLRHVIDRYLPVARFEELEVAFQCVAACIEDAGGEWFDSGELVWPVVASCAVPGLFPPVEIAGRHYLDGGLVHSIPVGRALALGATRIVVLQVGRVEQPLTVPTKPWEVGTVAFEIARRHRFVHEMESVPADVEMHVLPSGAPASPNLSIGQARAGKMRGRMQQAYEASSAYLDGVGGLEGAPPEASGD
jgi:NTE family protein